MVQKEDEIHRWMDRQYERLISLGMSPKEAYEKTVNRLLARWALAQKDPVDGIMKIEQILEELYGNESKEG